MGLRIGGEVERVDGRELSYGDFVERYMKGNRPVVLTGLMDGWRACRDWVTHDGRPNLPFFSDNFGKSLVQIADCNRREFTDQKRLEMSVSEFIRYWLDLSEATCTPAKYTAGLSCSSETHSLLYLKDWHFVKEYPEYVAYTTPPFFIDDWLNIYLDSHRMHRDNDTHQNEISCSDYRFVYMGAEGTWTPLHTDVFRSYSWSANVCGKKLWLFLPPSQFDLVFDRNLKNSVYNVYEEVSEKQFPGFEKAVWLECTQEQNDIIFVPSGWCHQVHNLEDAISINHNWFNAYNLSWVWNLLLKDYNEAKEYIDDIRDICDDFESLCQRNLAANTGMNFYDFFTLITRFALANLTHMYLLRDGEIVISKPSRRDHHLVSNLISIRAIALNMKSVVSSPENLDNCSVESCSTYYVDIEKILEEPDFLKLCMALIRAYETIDERSHDWGVGNSSLCPTDLNCLKENLRKLNFIQVLGSKIHNPEDLVKVVDRAILGHSSACSNCNIAI